jgi:AP endonuclease-1
MSRRSGRKATNAPSYTETTSLNEAIRPIEPNTPPSKKGRKAVEEQLEAERETVGDHTASENSPVKSQKSSTKRKVEVEKVRDETDDKKVKKRKTKEEKESEEMPLAVRTPIETLKRAMYIGAHVSGAGGKHHV